MNKLWIIGDSFWCRNAILENSTPLPGDSWVEHFLTNCELDFDWGSNSWCKGGSSNDWLVYGLYHITHNPKFNIDTDTVLIGFTLNHRRVVRLQPTREFEIDNGWKNLTNLDLTIVQPNTMADMHYSDNINKYGNILMDRGWNKNMLLKEADYTTNHIDFEWLEYQQSQLVDGAISIAKSRGVNIIPHRGCMFLFGEHRQERKDCKYNWHNSEIFDVPSFWIGIDADRQERLQTEGIDEAELPKEETWQSKYLTHMSPVGAKAYGDAFSEWWSK